MSSDRALVHIGDAEIVDGVLVRDPKRPPSRATLVVGTAVVAAAAIAAVGAAALSARRSAQSLSS